MWRSISVAHLIEEFISDDELHRTFRDSTRRKYRKVLTACQEYMETEGKTLVPIAPGEAVFRVHDVRDWLGRMSGGSPSPRTWATCLRILSSFVKFGLAKEWWGQDPLPTRPPHPHPSRPSITPVKASQIPEMLEAAETIRSEESRIPAETLHRDKVIVGLLNYGALRISELRKLELSHVYTPAGEPRREMVVTGKGNKTRTVPLISRARALLADYWEHERQNLSGPWLLPGADPAQPLHVRRIRTIYSRIAKRAGAPVRPHAARHGTLTTLVEHAALKARRQGQDAETAAQGALPAAAKLAGHESTDTTKVYVHHAVASIADELEEAFASVE